VHEGFLRVFTGLNEARKGLESGCTILPKGIGLLLFQGHKVI
jgi:hypothetical protein